MSSFGPKYLFNMKKLREFWNQYKEYIQLDLVMYVLMFLVILVFALIKFVF